jgi:hypothetical protein
LTLGLGLWLLGPFLGLNPLPGQETHLHPAGLAGEVLASRDLLRPLPRACHQRVLGIGIPQLGVLLGQGKRLALAPPLGLLLEIRRNAVANELLGDVASATVDQVIHELLRRVSDGGRLTGKSRLRWYCGLPEARVSERGLGLTRHHLGLPRKLGWKTGGRCLRVDLRLPLLGRLRLAGTGAEELRGERVDLRRAGYVVHPLKQLLGPVGRRLLALRLSWSALGGIRHRGAGEGRHLRLGRLWRRWSGLSGSGRLSGLRLWRRRRLGDGGRAAGGRLTAGDRRHTVDRLEV